jgi:hypothetical protein
MPMSVVKRLRMRCVTLRLPSKLSAVEMQVCGSDKSLGRVKTRALGEVGEKQDRLGLCHDRSHQ